MRLWGAGLTTRRRHFGVEQTKRKDQSLSSFCRLPPSNLLFHSVLSYPPLLFPISILASTPLGIRPQPSTSFQIRRSGSTIGCVPGTTKPDVFVLLRQRAFYNRRYFNLWFNPDLIWDGSHATRSVFHLPILLHCASMSYTPPALQNRLIVLLKRLEPLTSQVLKRSVWQSGRLH